MVVVFISPFSWVVSTTTGATVYGASTSMLKSMGFMDELSDDTLVLLLEALFTSEGVPSLSLDAFVE